MEKPTLPLLNNDLYALTAMNEQGAKSDPCVFTKCQKFGVVRPAIGVGQVLEAIAVSPDSSHVFVTNSAYNYVSIIEVNLANDPPFRVLPTRVSTGRNPHGIAVSPDGKYVFVANYDDNSVTVFGGTPPFQPFPAIPAGIRPTCLAVSPDGRYVFVPNNHGHRAETALSVIDTANAPSFQVIQGPTTDSNSSIIRMAISPDGLYVFLSGAWSNSLRVVQIEAGANPPYKVLSSLAVDVPWGVAVSLDSHYVFVANIEAHSVSVIEVSSGPSFQVLSPPVDTGSEPRALTVSPDGRFLFLTNHDYVLVWVIDKNSHPPVQLLQTFSLGVSVREAIAASPDGHFIFVIGHDSISVIEPVVVSK